MKRRQTKPTSQILRESLSNFANLVSIGHITSLATPIPVPERFPPSHVLTWDRKRKRPKIMRGTDYYNELQDKRKRGIV